MLVRVALPVQHWAEKQQGHGDADDHGKHEVHRGNAHQAGQFGGKVLDLRHGQEIKDKGHDRYGADEVRAED